MALSTDFCFCKVLRCTKAAFPKKKKRIKCETKSRNATLGSSLWTECPSKTGESISTKDNPSTLPTNPYAAEYAKIQPVDLTEIGHPKSTEKQPASEEKTQQYTFISGQTVCIREDNDYPFIVAPLFARNFVCVTILQENQHQHCKKQNPM